MRLGRVTLADARLLTFGHRWNQSADRFEAHATLDSACAKGRRLGTFRGPLVGQ
jgi:hypothetical protein